MIELRGVRKDYENVRALDGLDLTVGTGDLFGYIGPNGAGKSTTIKILATLEFPDRGRVTIDGIDVIANPEKIRGLIGYMPELFGLYDTMPVHEYLETFARIYRAPLKAADDVLELAGLQAKREALAGTLSKGNRQRLYIAKILLHNPAVLLLDEPASGLDPLARIELRELLKELHRMGKTILISSHILSDLEDICDTIGIIEQGKLLVSGELSALKEEMRAQFQVRALVDGDPARMVAWLESQANVSGARFHGQSVEFDFQGERGEVHQFLARAVEAAPIYSFEANEGSLEEIFMRITKGTVS